MREIGGKGVRRRARRGLRRWVTRGMARMTVRAERFWKTSFGSGPVWVWAAWETRLVLIWEWQVQAMGNARLGLN
jgi:hypothetical protein